MGKHDKRHLGLRPFMRGACHYLGDLKSENRSRTAQALPSGGTIDGHGAASVTERLGAFAGWRAPFKAYSERRSGLYATAFAVLLAANAAA